MTTLLDRFLRYVRIDTQSDESSSSVPSTMKQLDLCRLLADECRALGLQEVTLDEYGIVMGTIPATVSGNGPAIGWVAHVDTSPETSGKNVKPQVLANYPGGDIPLPGDRSKVIRVEENPELKTLIGKTIITTDGTTLLGSDDKSGVAVIMAAAEYLMQHKEIAHGPIRVCFTCDEEIGRGVDHLDLKKLNVCCAYTLDGGGTGEVDMETFSADKVTITVTGVNIHPSIGKGKMVNAIRILAEFLAALPPELSPERTDERDGFLHPYHIEGSVAEASAGMLLRDFETEKLLEYRKLLEGIAAKLREKHPQGKIDLKFVEQYRNMRDGLDKEPRVVPKALAAMRAVGLTPKQTIVRGGTDGSRLTALGVPTPNLSTGEHNPHSPLEWTCLEEMQTAVDVLVKLAEEWGKERA
ncbi:MAG: peptidase T [Planctomycetales bacterium]